MLNSMTGYGRGNVATDEFVVSLEIRSVNNRYCDVSIRSTKGFQDLDEEIKGLIQKKLCRGKIFCTINVEQASNGNAAKLIDENALKNKMDMLRKIGNLAGIKEPIRLEHILENNDIFGQTDEPDKDALKVQILSGLDEALGKLTEMRSSEGSLLYDDIVSRLNGMQETLVQVKKISASNPEIQLDKLRERAQTLFAKEIEPARLDQELAILVDKLDITEECVRFASHIEQFRKYIELTEPVGRRLDFLLQEMNREANTIASKVNNAEISHMVVEVKNYIENLREQIQNIV